MTHENDLLSSGSISRTSRFCDGIEGVNLELWKENSEWRKSYAKFCVEGSKISSEDGKFRST